MFGQKTAFGQAGGAFGKPAFGQAGGGFGQAAGGFGQAAGGFGQAAGGFGAAANPNPNGDSQCNPAPQDSVSCLQFSPANGGKTHLAATCWDGNTICYQVDAQGNTTSPAHKVHPQGVPALSCAWHHEGTSIFVGYGDNSAQHFDLNTQALTQVAQHAAPVKCVAWSQPINCLVTGSWDKTVKFWQPGSPNAAASIQLQERCYAMDLRDEYLVVGTADRHVQIFDVRKPNQQLKSEISPLKYQTRTVALFPEKDGYAIGSIEGKVGVQYFQEQGQKKHFSFRCHRSEPGAGSTPQDVYSVNCICFNNKYGTFATCGSDGVYNFWDKQNKQRLKQFKKMPQPITCATFSHDSSIFAYASCYDWHKGMDGVDPSSPKNIFLHSCTQQELEKRRKTSNRR
jgi:mRNA export factor|eukprot:SAG25_NODE_405_length_8429_cov_37.062493_3_plen_397_part_00